MRGRRRRKRVVLFVVERNRKAVGFDSEVENASVTMLNSTSNIRGQERREYTSR